MYQKIKAKFKANPTIFYACSIVASWAGVGSLMNFRTLAINNGAAAAIIWAVFNSLACIFFGLFAEYIPTVRRIMQSKVMFYFIGFLTVFQTWTQMSGIYEIFGDTPIGTTGGTLIVYGTCLVFLFMLLKEGMIRNVLSDGFSWVVVYGLLAVVVIAVASLYNANAELAHLQKIGVKDVCVLWCGSTLQNNKAWLSTTVPDCMYYEATYDGDKKELRLDAYRKIQSVSIPC